MIITRPAIWKKVQRHAWPYLLGALAALFIFGWFYGSRFSLNLRYPLAPTGDLWSEFALVKALLAGEWRPFGTAVIQRGGAPFGPVWFGVDYPLLMQLQYALFMGIGLFIRNVFGVINLYYLLTFVLATWAMMFSCRIFRIRYEIGAVLGLLFAFLPYHFIRYQHIMLAGYFLIPLGGVVALWLWSAKPLFFQNAGSNLFWKNWDRKAWLALAFCLLIGWWHVDYAFFFCLFAALAGVSAAVYRKNWRHAASAGLVVLITVFALGLMLGPVLYGRHLLGRNAAVAHRASVESELYGLKLMNVFLPPADHRVPFVRHLADKYYSPLGGGIREYMGAVGIMGFLLALLGLAWLRNPSTTLRKISFLTGMGVLYATMGGGSSLFAVLVSPQLRCPERIKPYLAFFSLWIIAWVLQRLKTKVNNWRIFYPALALLLVAGLADQITPGMVFNPAQAEVEQDRRFFQAVEQEAPSGAVLQLPFVSCPENGPVNEMSDSSHWRAYIFTQNLSWSYGAFRGRPAAAKIEALSRAPLNLANLRAAGYTGIYLDRFGYSRRQCPEEQGLRRDLGTPLESENKRFLFFKL